ncbi:MAG: acylphosphatase [Gammaproteobacteria bacterium]|nr:acylphosphatase [Gammaproteobacteria bacterium]NNM00511.1 acylphosphatase [Gammaproteobacteria bacterium]
MPSTRHYIIAGRVQGVWYRASARQEAQRLGITGWVRNLPDGRVEALATGSAPALARFEAWLARGPSRARVEEVTVADRTSESFDDFSVR